MIKLKRSACIISAFILLLAFSACSCSGGDSKDKTLSQGSGLESGIPPMIPSHSHPYDDFDPYATISDSIKGSTVRFATWEDFTDPSYIGNVPLNNFYADTGLNVEFMEIPEIGYVETIIKKIAAGDSPDVFMSGGINSFPLTLDIAAPINKVSTVDLNEPIWDQTMLETATIDGNIYLLSATSSPWNESTLVYYNETLFMENGFKTPEKYYNEGTWTWDVFAKCAREIKGLGTAYTGAYAERDHVLSSGGYTLLRYGYEQFASGVTTEMFGALRVYTDMLDEGLLDGDEAAFRNGTCGMYIGNTNELMTDGAWKGMDPEDIGVTYLPSFEEGKQGRTPSEHNMYGITRGAANADAAGYFIRYWLDYNSYDLAGMFLSNELGNFYYELTNQAANAKCFSFDDAAAYLIGFGSREHFWSRYDSPLGTTAPANELADLVNRAVDEADGKISEVKYLNQTEYQ